MKALLLEGKDQWRSMEIGEMDEPVPGEGEVVVRVHAAGLNPVDYKLASSGNPNWSYPHVLGLDVAGTIHSVGPGVINFEKGERVLYHGDMLEQGGFAEYAKTTVHTISRIPEGVTFEEAAALPTAGYTAYQALHRKLPLDRIETLLIHGGAGGVGGFGVQLAKLAGKKVITTASAHNHEAVRALGADLVIDYKNDDVNKKVLEFTEGRGVEAVIDTISSESATRSLEIISHGGHIAHIAGAPDYEKVKPFTQVISFHEIALGAIHRAGDLKIESDLARIGDDMLKLVAEKKLNTLLERTISLSEVPSALEELAERHVRGKMVARM